MGGSLSGPKSAPSFPPATPPPPSRMEQSPASEAVRMAHAHTSIHYPELPPPQQQQQQQQQADADPNPPNFFQRFNRPPPAITPHHTNAQNAARVDDAMLSRKRRTTGRTDGPHKLTDKG